MLIYIISDMFGCSQETKTLYFELVYEARSGDIWAKVEIVLLSICFLMGCFSETLRGPWCTWCTWHKGTALHRGS